MQTADRPLSVPNDVGFFFFIGVVVLSIALALVLTFQHVHSLHVTTAAPTSPAVQSAEQMCQNESDHANTGGVTEPIAISQIRDQVYASCMAGHGFPLGP